MKNKFTFSSHSFALISFKTTYDVNLSPDYQRSFIWNKDFKQKLIFSVIKGYPIGSFVVHENKLQDSKDIRYDVVDGQQRLRTLFDFIDMLFEISGDDAMEIFEIVKDDYSNTEKQDKKIKNLFNKFNNRRRKITLKFDLLPSSVQERIKNFNLWIILITSSISHEEVRQYFSFIQNQEKLSAGEIIKSFSCSFDNLLREKTNNLSQILKIINFNNSRFDFNKIFCSIVGILNDKIKIGAKDADIKKFCNNYDNNLVCNKTASEIISKLNEFFNDMAVYNNSSNLVKFNKRMLKIFLLLIGNDKMNKLNITDKLKFLKEFKLFDEKLKSFGSINANPNDTFNFVDDSRIRDAVIEDHRFIANLMKGYHTLEDLNIGISKVVDMLNRYYLN